MVRTGSDAGRYGAREHVGERSGRRHARRSARASVLATVGVVAGMAGAAFGSTGAGAAVGASGQNWSVQPAPVGAKWLSSQLNAVSCVSATRCQAVGMYQPPSGSVRALAESWDGTRWSIDQLASPTGTQSSSLWAVSCPAANECLASGNYSVSQNQWKTLVEIWNGSSWRASSPSSPVTSQPYGPTISCASAKVCTLVGNYVPTSGHLVSFATRWDGTSWHAESVPSPAGTVDSVLGTVDCPTTTSCIAVGYSGPNSSLTMPLVERWNGSKWSIVPVPEPLAAQQASLQGVSCVSGTCTLVGDYENATGGWRNLVEVGSGSTWHIQAAPDVLRAQTNSLVAVSCTAAGSCTATGYSVNKAGWQAVALSEIAGHWSLDAVPQPSGSTVAFFNGVSCSSAAACVATGGSDQGVLVERSS